MGSISLRIRFDKMDEFIKIYDGIRYLVLWVKFIMGGVIKLVIGLNIL